MKSTNRMAFFNILSTVLLSGISIFTAPLFSRMLGDSGYGVVSVYTTWVSIIAVVFTLQTQQTLVHARVSFPETEQVKYQSSVMTLSCVTYLACALLVILFLDPVSRMLKMEKSIVILLLFHAFGMYCVGFINNKFTYEFQAEKNFAISVGTTVTTIGLSLLLIPSFPRSANFYGRILALAVTYGVLGICLCTYILKGGRTFYRQEYWRFCVPLATPLVFQCLADLLLGHSGRIILQHMETDAVVGQYSLAYSFAGIIYTLFTALNNSWCPFFMENMKNNRTEKVHSLSCNFLELYTVLAMGFMLLSREVYHVFASQEFWNGTNLVPVFAVSYYMIFLSTFSINYELYHKKTKLIAMGTAVSMTINIGLSYILIQVIGMMGAALATAISHGAQVLFHQFMASRIGRGKYFPFPVKIYLPYLTACLVAFGITLLTPEVWWFRWPLGAVVGLWELYRINKRKTIF